MEITHFLYSVLTTIGPTRFSPTHPFCCTNLNRKFVEIYLNVIFICLTLKSNLQLGAGVWMEWIEKVLGTKKWIDVSAGGGYKIVARLVSHTRDYQGLVPTTSKPSENI